MPLIAPSFLAADFTNLQKDVFLMNTCADLFHMDIMDGVFVPNISYGFPVLNAIASLAERPLDVHLMISEPARYIERFAAVKGVEMISFHPDAAKDVLSTLELIRKCGVRAGLAINPDIPLESIYPYLDKCDFVVLMSVFAGFGGQKFIPAVFDRISTLKEEISRRGLNVLIEVDGGVSSANSAELTRSGADILVAGTSVFKSDDPAAAVALLRNMKN